jgi:hypothetical protein
MLDIFMAYAKHEQEKEDIIKEIIERYHNGEENIDIRLDDDFSDSDLDYIREEVRKRLS